MKDWELIEDDFPEGLPSPKKKTQKDFEEIINKKDLNSFELDEVMLEG